VALDLTFHTVDLPITLSILSPKKYKIERRLE